MTDQPYDVIVVGAGSMGMSAGYYLAKAGIRTLMIDAFDPPHREGSHHGETRLIRHAYKSGSLYIPMVLRAHNLWNELEDLAGTELLVPSGVLNIADPDHYSFQNRPEDAKAFGIAVEMLDAAEMRKRWPGLSLPEHFVGMYEPKAGYLHSEKCVASYRKLAIAAGAKLLTDTPVQRVEAGKEGVTIHTKDGVYHADKALLSAGAWFQSLEPFVSIPIRPVRKSFGWFQTGPSLFDPEHFPGFTLHGAEGGYYGFPNIDSAGLKIGRHDTGLEWKPGESFEPFGRYVEDERDLRHVLESYMPQAAGKLIRGSVCKYEISPDEHFIIDYHPAYPNIIIAGGFSGHGFKFSSVVGEMVADLIRKNHTDFDIRPFALSRFR
jgi:N-methyl-L-tryptophan oxidase